MLQQPMGAGQGRGLFVQAVEQVLSINGFAADPDAGAFCWRRKDLVDPRLPEFDPGPAGSEASTLTTEPARQTTIRL